MKDPLIIGALGGSGTRVVARIVRQMGYFIGEYLNVSEDAMEFVPFYDHWINPFSAYRLQGAHLDLDRMGLDFAECVVRHRAPLHERNRHWGWKEPRSIYLLPFFHRIFPDMKFIQVLRDGRDMAFSDNQNQLRLHGAAMLDENDAARPQPVQTARLWQQVNLQAAEYGESRLKEHYLALRFEDLCYNPASTIDKLQHFLAPSRMSDLDTIRNEIVPPPTIGRWRACEDATLLKEIQTAARRGLARFNYL